MRQHWRSVLHNAWYIQRVLYVQQCVPRVLYALLCLIFNTTLGDTEQRSPHFTGKETVAQRLKRLSMVG